MRRKRRKNHRGTRAEEFYRLWAFHHRHCQACGISDHEAKHDRERRPGTLSTHHIIGASGRSHEACNLLRMCQRCHDLAEQKLIINPRTKEAYQKLSKQDCIAIKFAREPEEFNLARLIELVGYQLDEPTAVPTWIDQEYFRRRPWELPNQQPQ